MHVQEEGGAENDRSHGATWLVDTAMLTSSLANRVQGKGFVREWRSNGIRFYRGSYRGFIIRFWHVRAFTPVRATIGFASGFLSSVESRTKKQNPRRFRGPIVHGPPLSTLLRCITSSSRVPCHFYREKDEYTPSFRKRRCLCFVCMCVCVCLCRDTARNGPLFASELHQGYFYRRVHCSLFTVKAIYVRSLMYESI